MFCLFFCLDAKETKVIRGFVIVFNGAYETASLSSRTTRSAPRVCPANATWNFVLSSRFLKNAISCFALFLRCLRDFVIISLSADSYLKQ